MSMFDDPGFQKMLRQAKARRVLCAFRCVYSWVLVMGPIILLSYLVERLSRAWLWVYVLCIPVLFVLGVVAWCKGSNGLLAPAHKWLLKFNKAPTAEGLCRVCAVLVSNRREHRYHRVELDLMRRAQTVAHSNPEAVPAELLEFYTSLLRACHVAGA